MDGSRDEIVGRAERLIRRGELGEAAALLESWTRSHPEDQAAANRLRAVRSLSDPTEAASFVPAPVAVVAAAPVAAPNRPLPADPLACLGELLGRIQANRRPGF